MGMRPGSVMLFVMAIAASPAAAQWSASRVDSHAPIGVMGDHRHEAGEVMLSYRFMQMMMEGSRDGTDAVADADIVAAGGPYGFMVTPTEMTMQMHMFGAMLGLNERITLMGMLNYINNSMDHITRPGGSFTTESSGLGDVRVGAMIGLADPGNQAIHVNAFLSVPTGSIEAEDVVPPVGTSDVQLPYPMQLGSGTWDLMPALTYLGQAGPVSWGSQLGGTFRLGENDRGWTLGNRVFGTAWLGRVLSRNVSAAVRLEAAKVGDIEGSDDPAPSVNPTAVPTARRDLRGGTTVEAALSTNIYFPQLSAFRIAIEGLYPLYRDLDGPQLERDWTLFVGLQLVPVR